jgi:hypothetical protein
MTSTTYQGIGEVFQGNTSIGRYRYELVAVGKEKDRRAGVLYVGDRSVVLSALVGTKLNLHLEDGSQCQFQITDVGSKMGITVISQKLH